MSATCEIELQDRSETSGAECHVEGDPRPGHVGAVECGMPGENDPADAQGSCGGHVYPSTDGLAVECRIFRRHDAGGYEQGDAGVINARKTLHECLVSDTVHGVPHGAADEAFASCEEENGGDEDVGVGAEGEVDGGGVEVECDCYDDEEADGVRPDIYQFVGNTEHRTHTIDFGCGKTVAVLDVRVHFPRCGQVVVSDETMFAGADNGSFDVFFEGFGRLLRLFYTFVYYFSGSFEAFVYYSSAFVHETSCCPCEALFPHLIRSSFEVRQEVLQESNACVDLLVQGFLRRQSILIPSFYSLNHNFCPLPPRPYHLSRNLTTSCPHSL